MKERVLSQKFKKKVVLRGAQRAGVHDKTLVEQ